MVLFVVSVLAFSQRIKWRWYGGVDCRYSSIEVRVYGYVYWVDCGVYLYFSIFAIFALLLF
jgi:hypothetical protein